MLNAQVGHEPGTFADPDFSAHDSTVDHRAPIIHVYTSISKVLQNYTN